MAAFAGASHFIKLPVLDHVPAPAVAIDADGTITDLNDRAAGLFGRARAELAGSSMADILDHSSRKPLLEYLANPLSDSLEVKLAGRDQWLLVAVGGREGGRLQVVLLDVTPYVVRQRAHAEARFSAERVANSKTDLLARLSHEIRSALASMIGFAEMLRENVDPANGELANIITQSGRHLLDTLNSVMDLSRLEFHEGEMEFDEVDVVRRVRERVSMFRPQIRGRNIELTFRHDEEEIQARLNGTFLDRIVHNLIDNAIKYTQAGKVEVTVERRDRRVWIYVADTGTGIDATFMPRLFSPFERERQASEWASDETTEGTPEGVGLGLAITKYLVEIMGGQISAHSVKGEGSTFTVSFPSPSPPHPGAAS